MKIEIVKYETVGELLERLAPIDPSTPLLSPVTVSQGYTIPFGFYVNIESDDVVSN